MENVGDKMLLEAELERIGEEQISGCFRRLILLRW
jgi:hypothetical protein